MFTSLLTKKEDINGGRDNGVCLDSTFTMIIGTGVFFFFFSFSFISILMSCLFNCLSNILAN